MSVIRTLIEHLRRRKAGIELAKGDLPREAVITWPAVFWGECAFCGHEWREGELVGTITTAYERTVDGAWRRSPGVRVVDALCVDRARVEGDFTVAMARREGAL